MNNGDSVDTNPLEYEVPQIELYVTLILPLYLVKLMAPLTFHSSKSRLAYEQEIPTYPGIKTISI